MNLSEPAAIAGQPAAAFTAAAAALVSSNDTLGIITQLLRDATQAVEADGAGLVITGSDRGVELLAAISHRAEDLELFQLQAETGPCLDAIEIRDTVIAVTADEIAERWPGLSAAFVQAGFTSLHAAPLRWRAQVLGAINFFWNSEQDTSANARLIRGYADIATIAIVHAEQVTSTEVTERVRAALTSRHLIEQAKGVLAYREHLDMTTAYHQLLHRAGQDGVSLSTEAATIIEQAQRRGHELNDPLP